MKLKMSLLALVLVSFIGCEDDMEDLAKDQAVLASGKITFSADPCDDDVEEVNITVDGQINISSASTTYVMKFTTDASKKNAQTTVIGCDAFEITWNQSETHTASSTRTFIANNNRSCKFLKSVGTESFGDVLNLTIKTHFSKTNVEVAESLKAQVDLSKVSFQNGETVASTSCASVKPTSGGRVSNDGSREVNFKLDLGISADSHSRAVQEN